MKSTQLGEFIKTETTKWTKVVKESGAVVDWFTDLLIYWFTDLLIDWLFDLVIKLSIVGDLHCRLQFMGYLTHAKNTFVSAWSLVKISTTGYWWLAFNTTCSGKGPWFLPLIGARGKFAIPRSIVNVCSSAYQVPWILGSGALPSRRT